MDLDRAKVVDGTLAAALTILFLWGLRLPGTRNGASGAIFIGIFARMQTSPMLSNVKLDKDPQ